jgi:hypothetical protein
MDGRGSVVAVLLCMKPWRDMRFAIAKLSAPSVALVPHFALQLAAITSSSRVSSVTIRRHLTASPRVVGFGWTGAFGEGSRFATRRVELGARGDPAASFFMRLTASAAFVALP